MERKIKITPFVGVGDFYLMSSFDKVLQQLKDKKIKYNVSIYPNADCTPAVEWKIIIANNIYFYFAKDKLFKIYIENSFCGILPNGIYLGISMEEALKLDDTLAYDDWNEDWLSSQGYWLEDNVETQKVESISIFIKELLDESVFEKYEW